MFDIAAIPGIISGRCAGSFSAGGGATEFFLLGARPNRVIRLTAESFFGSFLGSSGISGGGVELRRKSARDSDSSRFFFGGAGRMRERSLRPPKLSSRSPSRSMAYGSLTRRCFLTGAPSNAEEVPVP